MVIKDFAYYPWKDKIYNFFKYFFISFFILNAVFDIVVTIIVFNDSGKPIPLPALKDLEGNSTLNESTHPTNHRLIRDELLSILLKLPFLILQIPIMFFLSWTSWTFIKRCHMSNVRVEMVQIKQRGRSFSF